MSYGPKRLLNTANGMRTDCVRIVIVDDDPNRRNELRGHLPTGDAYISIDIREAGNKGDARTLVANTPADLLILDLVLPLTRDGQPEPDGGLLLIEEMLHGPAAPRLPRHIVALSADQGACESFNANYFGFGWKALHVSPENGDWARQIGYLATELKSAAHIRLHDSVDVVFFAALPTPELTAVRDESGIAWTAIDTFDNGDLVYRATLQSADRRPLRAVLASASRMGPYEAGVRSSYLIARFSPRLVAMPGICASLRGREHRPASIIVADNLGDYDSGKYKTKGQDRVFVPRPNPFEADAEVTTRARAVSESPGFKLRVLERCGEGGSDSNAVAIHVGHYATGASVVADAAMGRAVKRRIVGAVALEMEAYAVALACRRAPGPRPKVLIAKAVSDYADKHKRDCDRVKAARRSAAFCVEFACEFALSLPRD